MIESKYYDFADCTVPTALDPDTTVDIPAGRHIVVFDDPVSRKDNGLECDIRWTGIVVRIERSVLINLIKDKLAAEV